MMRLSPILLIFLIYSCVTSRSIKHYSNKKDLIIRKVEGVNFFNGRIEVQEIKKKPIKEPFYLLYDHDTLKFFSKSKWITNNEFIYKISSKTDSNLTFRRSSLLVNYFTADTLLFSRNSAIYKRCLYDNRELIRVELKQYSFQNDSLFTFRYIFGDDLSQVPSIYESKSFFEGKPKQPGDLFNDFSTDKWTLTKSLF